MRIRKQSAELPVHQPVLLLHGEACLLIDDDDDDDDDKIKPSGGNVGAAYGYYYSRVSFA